MTDSILTFRQRALKALLEPGTAIQTLLDAIDKIEALEEEVEELRKDKARMDYVESLAGHIDLRARLQ